MDDTIINNKLQPLMVAPHVVMLSKSQPVSSFSLRNTSVLQSRFHIEIPHPSFGVTVKPHRGTLPPHSPCLLTVEHSFGFDDRLSDSIVAESTKNLKIILKVGNIF